jgi:hypothetical protein
MTSSYPGFKVHIMGPTGSGKTHSLASLHKTGLEVFILFLDPGLTTLIKAFCDPPPDGLGMPTPPSNFHWQSVRVSTPNFANLEATAKQIGQFDLAGLARIKDLKRSINNPLERIYGALNNFIDERTGKEYGPVVDWGTDKVLVIDNLSSLSRGIMQAVVGSAPLRDKPHYGLGQGQLSNTILGLTEGTGTHFILLSHPDREMDEVMGGIKLFPSNIGKALNSNFNQPFDDVILAARETDKFYWDTASSQADLKARHLPISPKLPATFEPIWRKWEARKAAATA